MVDLDRRTMWLIQKKKDGWRSLLRIICNIYSSVHMRNIPVNNYTPEAISVLGEFPGQVNEVVFDPKKTQIKHYVRVFYNSEFGTKTHFNSTKNNFYHIQ